MESLRRFVPRSTFRNAERTEAGPSGAATETDGEAIALIDLTDAPGDVAGALSKIDCDKTTK